MLYYFRGGKSVRSTRKALKSGQWQSVAVTKAANGTVALYLDGERIGSGKLSGEYADSDTRIGGHPDRRECRYNGKMDDVMIWNRALTDAEVKQIHQLTGGK